MDQHWNDIIEGCKRQDLSKQEELYRICYTPMMKVCIRYSRDNDDAGAMYNEGMFKVFNSIGQFRDEGDFQGWVRRIIVNTCVDHCRKQTKFRHQPLEAIIENRVSVDPDIYQRLSATDVIALLQGLPRNTALVFNLFVLEGYKHEEIGQILGISGGTSKWHLNEARRLLKAKLETILKKEVYSDAI